MRKGVIYKWTNKITGECYIGQTMDEVGRKKAHERCNGNSKFYKAIKYYGLMNFDYEKIEEVNEDKLDEREIYWIRFYDSINHGYNTSKGGQNYIHRLSKEEKKELGLHYTGKPYFGYDTNKDGKYIINRENAKIVNNIFTDYAKGMSFRYLSKKYNRHYNSIKVIIRNTCYYGDNNKPAIITKELFDKAQSMRTTKKLNFKETDHPLKGKLYDENNNLFSSNNAAKYFINKNTGRTISFNVINKLLDNINIEFDKIIVTWTNSSHRRFDIILDNKIIQVYDVMLNNRGHKIILL